MKFAYLWCLFSLVGMPLHAERKITGLEDMKNLNDPSKRVVKRLLDKYSKGIPEGHSIDAKIVWSTFDNDLERLILTPKNAGGEIEGEVQTFVRAQLYRVVPYKAGKRDGLEYTTKYDYKLKKQLRLKETPWKEGKIHGVKKSFYKSGKIRNESPYVMGKIHGVCKAYDLPGRVEKETTYENGKRHGDLKEFYAMSGKLRKVVPYHKGKIHGVLREYYDNGKLKKEMPLVMDEYHGIEKMYSESGKLEKERYWIKDKKVSAAKFRSHFR